MPIEKPPYFPFYVNDFCSDGKVEAMTTEEVGAYTLLLCKAWMEEPSGTIPNDDRILSKWTRLAIDKWNELKDNILSPFVLLQNGRFGQKRMMHEHKKLMQYKKERSESGKIGAEKKWHSHSLANGSAIAQPMANDSISLSLSSSLSKKHTDIVRSWFEEIWPKYPSKGRINKKKAYSHFSATVKTEEDYAAICKALDNYIKSGRVGNGYVQNASTWFNNWHDWVDYVEPEIIKAAPPAAQRQPLPEISEILERRKQEEQSNVGQ